MSRCCQFRAFAVQRYTSSGKVPSRRRPRQESVGMYIVTAVEGRDPESRSLHENFTNFTSYRQWQYNLIAEPRPLSRTGSETRDHGPPPFCFWSNEHPTSVTPSRCIFFVPPNATVTGTRQPSPSPPSMQLSNQSIRVNPRGFSEATHRTRVFSSHDVLRRSSSAPAAVVTVARVVS